MHEGIGYVIKPIGTDGFTRRTPDKNNLYLRGWIITMDKISIITPSYNQAAFLKETISSIASQEVGTQVEHIIIDAGSTDGSVELLKSTGEQVIWLSEPDRGQADAVNKGIRIATGEIIGWLNSDDLYLPGALKAVAGYFRDYPACQWLYGRCRIIDEAGKERWNWITGYKNARLKKFTQDKLLRENFISQPAVFFRKELFEKAGGLDLTLKYAMDYDLWLRFGMICPAGVIRKDLASFRRHRSSKSETGFRDQFFEQYAVAGRYNPSFFNRALHRFNIFKIITSYRIIGLFFRF
jgi:glycosyltransferase involved in cell wall biosynthesis